MNCHPLSTLASSGHYWTRRSRTHEWRMAYIDQPADTLTFIGTSADYPLGHYQRLYHTAELYGPIIAPAFDSPLSDGPDPF